MRAGEIRGGGGPDLEFPPMLLNDYPLDKIFWLHVIIQSDKGSGI